VVTLVVPSEPAWHQQVIYPHHHQQVGYPPPSAAGDTTIRRHHQIAGAGFTKWPLLPESKPI